MRVTLTLTLTLTLSCLERLAFGPSTAIERSLEAESGSEGAESIHFVFLSRVAPGWGWGLG